MSTFVHFYQFYTQESSVRISFGGFYRRIGLYWQQQRKGVAITMTKRTKLSDRLLPDYTRGEEIMNMVTHIVGGGLGVLVLLACLLKAIFVGNGYDLAGSIIYGVSMIYFLIAGTYSIIALCALREVSPVLGWGIFAFQWGMSALAVTLTAIDLHNYNTFSMICYIGMGWCIAPFFPQTVRTLTMPGFWLLLSGGIAYTIGAVLYGIGSKKRWMHSVFHIFVVLGSLLQFLCIILYVL